MKKRILCYGDSNTYGFDPRSFPDFRYPPAERWPELAAAREGWELFNLGLNGRTIPHRAAEIELAIEQIRLRLPLDCLIVMLGSNDALSMLELSAPAVARRMDTFLSALRKAFPALSLLLIAPPTVEIPVPGARELFEELVPLYRDLAEKHAAQFAAAALWALPLSADGVHLSPEGHRLFAAHVSESIRKLL